MKHCSKCGELKSLDLFYNDKRYKSGKTSACKKCRISAGLAAHYKWRKANPEKVATHYVTQRRNKLATKYGISFEELQQVLEAQNGKCAVCSKPISYGAADKKDTPHTDHDHVSGLFRGLLCLPCNTGIGMLNDSVALLQKATTYLINFQRERLSEKAPETGDATVCSHEKNNHEKLAEMTNSTIQ